MCMLTNYHSFLRRMRKKDAAKATEDKRIYGDLSSDDEQTTARNKMTAKKPKSKGVKWSIVFLLSLFVLPGIFGAASYFYDYLYPTVFCVVIFHILWCFHTFELSALM